MLRRRQNCVCTCVCTPPSAFSFLFLLLYGAVFARVRQPASSLFYIPPFYGPSRFGDGLLIVSTSPPCSIAQHAAIAPRGSSHLQL